MEINSPIPRPGSENTDYYDKSPARLSPSPAHMDPHIYMHNDFDMRSHQSFDPAVFAPAIVGERPTRSRARTMGNPGPLALWAFATVTSMLGTFNLFLPHQSNHIILPTALMFGGLAQFIAGFLDLFYGGTYTPTIFVSYGAFWVGNGIMMFPSAADTLHAYTTEFDLARANGVYHFWWSFYTLLHVGVSLRIKAGNFMSTLSLVFVFLTLFLEGLYYFTDNVPLLRTSGV
ncbi:GPR1/FUN34/yaaH family-domain-containing protein [Fennellomyces sp. T-0311]|nr:GPR1/FUN34/yaaH family-domain-containing protein [Fennellomyces sp. T-0311]